MTSTTEKTRIQNEHAAWSEFTPDRQPVLALAELNSLLRFSLPKLPHFSRPKLEREVRAELVPCRACPENA